MEALGLDVLFMGSNATRLLQGLWVAVQISAISVVLSIILGMLFGIFMTWKNPVAKVISRLYLEIVRIMPQLVLLYIVFFGATRVMGLNISAELSSIIVFVFWGTGEMGDLVRGALTSMIKTTSLLLMIGVIEMMKVGQQIIEANRMTSPNAVFGIYGTIMLLYFVICWPISMLANHLEKKWN